MILRTNPWPKLWAGLDMLSFLRYTFFLMGHLSLELEGLSPLGMFYASAHVILITSLLLSAVYTFKGKQLGLTIYFIQFPLRVYLGVWTFSVLLDLVTYQMEAPSVDRGLIVYVVMGLELVRLIYSILAYRAFAPLKEEEVG